MQNSNFRRPNSPVKCPRCAADNNLSYTKVCWQCGTHLTSSAKYRKSPPKPGLTFFGFLIRAFLTIVVLCILSVAGFVFYKTNRPATSKQLNSSGVMDAAALPADSWYKPSFQNLFRNRPTVPEILRKNDEVTSQVLKPGDIETMSLSAQMSFAVEDKGFSKSPEVLAFKKVGSAEVYKKREKMLRNIKTRIPSPFKKMDINEGFDGTKGWHEEINYNQDGNTQITVKEVSGAALENMKTSVDGWGNNFSPASYSYSHMDEVEKEPHFVIQSNDPSKPIALYFDAVSGFLTKTEDDKTTCLMLDYAESNGVNLPQTMYFRFVDADKTVVWMKLDNIVWTLNAPLEDSIFEKKIEN